MTLKFTKSLTFYRHAARSVLQLGVLISTAHTGDMYCILMIRSSFVSILRLSE